MNGFITFLLTILFPLLSIAAPSSLTYQGRILKQDGSPLEYSNVAFVFQITNPSGSCVIYQEQVSGINMVNSGGVFDVPIGKGTVQYVSAGTTILDAFNNNSTFTCGACTASGNTYTCSAGSSTYGARADDGRLLRVSFWDGIGWRTINTDNEIRSVPYAAYSLSAQKLGNNVADDFLLKGPIPTCPPDTFLTWNGSAMSCVPVSGAAGGTVTNVTSTNSYLVVANGTSAPALTLNVGTGANSVAAGNDTRIVNAMQTGAAAGGDLSGNYPNPKVAALQGVAVSTSAPGAGQFLKYNGTNWSGAALSSTDISDLATNYLTQASFNNSISAASCTVSQTMYWNSVAGKFQCQNINVGLAGDVTGSIGTAKVVALQNGAVSATAPTLNQVLQWNGSAWTPTNLPAQNPGTITGVTAGTGLTGGGTTGTVTLNVDAGIGANQIVKLDGTSRLPAVDGSQLTNLQASQIPNLSAAKITSGVLAVTQGGTGQSSYTDGQILIGNSVGNTLSKSTLTAGSGINITNGNGAITISALTSGTVTGVSGTAPVVVTGTTTPVVSLANGSAAGQVYRWDGTSAWTASKLGFSDLTGSVAGSQLPAFTGDVTLTGSGSVTATVNSVGGSTAANVHTAELLANAATSANSASAIVKRDASGNFVAGTITGSLTGAASLNVLKAGDSMSGNLTFAANTGNVYTAGSGVNTASLQGPSAAIGTSYVLRLPTAQGTANQFMTNDGSGNLSWTSLSSLGVASVAVTSPITNSGTATAPNISIQQANTTQAGYLSNTDWNTFNNKLSTTLSSANIFVGNGSNVATGVPASGDVTLTNGGAFTVTKLQGSTVSATAPATAGQVMRWSGSAWTPNFVSMFDLRSTITGTQAFGGVGCTAGQTLTWTAATDNLSCTNISISSSQVSFPSAVFLNDGNSLGATATLGTNDSFGLNFETAGNVRMSILSNGNVGIGTTNPASKLSVLGDGMYGGGVFSTYWDNDGSNLGVIRYRGSVASPSALLVNDRIGALIGGGAITSSSYVNNASVEFYADENYSASAAGSRITFLTTTNGATTRTEKMRIANNGNVGVGTVTPASTLHLSGTTGLLLDAAADSGGANAQGVAITGRRAANTLASPTNTQGNSTLVALNGRGYVDGAFSSLTSASIGFLTAENFTASAQGTHISFITTAQGTISPLERMRITAAGNVGIGLTTPNSTLHVKSAQQGTLTTYGSEKFALTLEQQYAGTGFGPALEFRTNDGTNTWSNAAIAARDPVDGSYSGALAFFTTAGGGINSTSMGRTKQTNLVERMRIDQSGNVGIGVTTPTYLLQLASDSAAKPGTSTWTIASDIRLKDVRAPFVRGLDALEGIHPIYFNYKKDNALGLPSDKEFVGIKAQDALAAVPEAVSQDKQGYYHVTNDAIIWTIMNSVKELYHRWMDNKADVERSLASIEERKADKAEIESLRAENLSLKENDEAKNAKIRELEERLEKIEQTLTPK